MVTKWAKIAMKYSFLECDYYEGTEGYVFPDSFKWVDGSTDSFAYSSFPKNRWFNVHDSGYCRVDNSRNTGFYVGSGSTAATDEDYFLESPITSGIYWNLEQTYIDVNLSTGNLRRNWRFVITNNLSATPITIREIGYIGEGMCYDQSGDYRQWRNFLIDRTVLGTALVIQPNESGSLKYSIELDYTPANS